MMCVPLLSSGRHVQYSQPLRIAYPFIIIRIFMSYSFGNTQRIFELQILLYYIETMYVVASGRRRPRDVNNVSHYPAKRPRYDYLHERECVSLPQQEACCHKYYLRPYEHCRPVELYGCRNPFDHDQPDLCRRNAHSYSLNGHRCSNSSTASGRKRKLEGMHGSTSRKRPTHYEGSVSYSQLLVNAFYFVPSFPFSMLLCRCCRSLCTCYIQQCRETMPWLGYKCQQCSVAMHND